MTQMLADRLAVLDSLETRGLSGTVSSVRGMAIHVRHLPIPLGSLVSIERTGNEGSMRGEVVGFDANTTVVMLYDALEGIQPGCVVRAEPEAGLVRVGPGLLGRVVDALGMPLDERGPIRETMQRPIHSEPVSAMQRERIEQPLPTGVRSIDGLLTIGRGQRVGIFSGPGVGKSTLLASIVRATAADAIVIALVGERGREAREFVDQTLGESGLERSIVVVSTSDESPLRRVRATQLAMAAADSLRDEGAHVLFCMDSLTRYAHALRQLGLASGEHPATRGYPPSVFAQLPRMIERAGALRGGGSVTGLYTVLVEGDDLTEPVADAALGVLDGHIVLSRSIASRGQYPAIDPLESVSRLAEQVCDENHRAARRELLRLLAAYSEIEDLLTIGAYAKGSNAASDIAIEMRPAILEFLTQAQDEVAAFPDTCRDLIQLATVALRMQQQLAAPTGSMP